MPIYEYQCTHCGQIYEVFQSFSDEPMKTCKQCSGEVTKLISNCSFQLKGTGWYVTDYGKKDTGSGGVATKEEKKSEEKKTAQEPSTEKKDF